MKRKTELPPETNRAIREFSDTVVSRVNAEMRQQKISRREMANRTGLTYNTVLNITSGRYYSFDSLIQVLQELGLGLRIRKEAGE